MTVLPTFTWMFTTTDLILPATLTATEGMSGVIVLGWILPNGVNHIRFDLRRSEDRFPLSPDEGDLIFSGSEKSFFDLDVVDGKTYFYTVFTVRHIDDDGAPVYVPYDAVSSASTAPRKVTVNKPRVDEYVPSRGEFGPQSFPLKGISKSVWGTLANDGLSTVDTIVAAVGAIVLAPTAGVIKKITIESELLATIDLATDFGAFVIRLAHVHLQPGIAVGMHVRAGQNIAKLGSAPLEFSIVKLPTGRYGQRTVRPSYFFLTVEARDGRG